MQRPRLRDLLPVTVRTFDPEEVTTKSHRETDPRGVGLTVQDVEAIWDAVVTFYKTGLHPAIALCIRRRGEIILDPVADRVSPLGRNPSRAVEDAQQRAQRCSGIAGKDD